MRTVILFAALLLLPAEHALAASARAVFVVQVKAKPEIVATDAKVKEHLEAMGLSVAMVDQLDPAPKMDGVDLVVISSSVSAHRLEAKYRDAPVPIVTWESYILPHMGMSGFKEDADYGTKEKERYLWMVNAPHPLAAGLPSGMLNVLEKGAPMNWGKPGLGATIIATLPGDPGKVAEFAYEKGATMDYDHIAPARRAFIFLDNETFTNLNAAGLKLFDAAIGWARGKAGG
jgi:hypothetical protein